METRFYFVIGDVLANAGAGAIVAVVCSALLGEAFPLAVAMPVGMIAGGIVAMPVGMLAASLFGAFEVILPVMTTGMLVGMVASMSGAAWVVMAVRGAVVGIGVLVATYLLNARLRGRRDVWTS